MQSLTKDRLRSESMASAVRSKKSLTYRQRSRHNDDSNSNPRTTRRKTPAREAVFGTAELLEHVLVHLPPLQLFALKQVSKRFEAVISGSTSFDVNRS